MRRPSPGQGGAALGAGGASWRLLVAVGALALLGLGAACFGKNGRWARLSGREAGAIQVVGRVALTPRHAVHLLRVGERTLIVGTGHGGPPALLGELPEPPTRNDDPRQPPGDAA